MFIPRRALAAVAALTAMQLSAATEKISATRSATIEEIVVHGKREAVEIDLSSVRVDVQGQRKTMSSSLDAALGRSALASVDERNPRG